MNIEIGAPYWGKELQGDGHEIMDLHIAQAIGIQDKGPWQKEAKELCDYLASKGMNGRQAADAVRSRYIQKEGPLAPTAQPQPIREDAPEEINIYSDGAVTMPQSQALAIG